MPSSNSLKRAQKYVKYQRAKDESRTYYEIQLGGNEVWREQNKDIASGRVAQLVNYLAEVLDDKAQDLVAKLKKARERYTKTMRNLDDAYLISQLSSIINLIESDEERNYQNKELENAPES